MANVIVALPDNVHSKPFAVSRLLQHHATENQMVHQHSDVLAYSLDGIVMRQTDGRTSGWGVMHNA